MAANRIKGITIEIGGDTTKLQTALKGVNTEVRNTQQQLKDESISEREAYSEDQKNYMIDYGLTIIKVIYSLVQ